MGEIVWTRICHATVATLLFVVLTAGLLPIQASAISAPSLLHNSDQFACDISLSLTEADCTDKNGTWAPARKWPDGWGRAGAQYGAFICATCHLRTPGNNNIKLIGASITAPDGTFPGGGTVKAREAIAKSSSDFGDDSDSHTTSQRVCEVCHSQTRYHRFNTTDQVSDGGDLGHFNNADCISCHRHGAGFRAGCSDCHGNGDTGDYWPDGVDNNKSSVYFDADPYDSAGSHTRHVKSLGGNGSCVNCHPLPQSGNAHINTDTNLYLSGTSFTGYDSGSKTCSTIDCHGDTDAVWGSTSCLGCHRVVQASRAAVGAQFAANSHHVQVTAPDVVTDGHCYQCHWEANSDGTIDPDYHGGTNSPAATVDLVIYAAGSRPTDYGAGTAVQYTVMADTDDGFRAEIAKLNEHCLSCHNASNSSTEPFADGKTPGEYAWDGTSIAERYSQTSTTAWGKYTGPNITPKATQTKAYSAHGNAIANQGGWDLNETWPDNRDGTVNIVCFDCHNSHGSQAAGTTTSYDNNFTPPANGGILKDTTATLGGATATYRPAAGGTADNKNQRNSGASLCMDCHLTATADADYPWGYNSTFGAKQKILGYDDSEYFGPSAAGAQQRYPYKANAAHKGGHFDASSTLKVNPTAEHQVNDLCTPCHDPHGVSPSLADVQQYSVPLLKGSWLTSPYLEDAAPAQNAAQTALPVGTKLSYHIDQNTFKDSIDASIDPATEGIAQTDIEFAGLCLNCHPKSSLTSDGSGTANAWKSKDRVHEAVKGWKTSNSTVQHRYSCSKCHTPHGGTGLARLMVTNCFNTGHKGGVSWTVSPRISGSYDMVGHGAGRVPGVYDYDDAWYVPAEVKVPSQATLAAACHGPGNDQSWNSVTPWGQPPPTVYGTIRLVWSSCDTIPGNVPTALDSASWTVHRGSYGGTLVASGSSGVGWDGIDDISIPVSATKYFVTVDWSWDDGNEVGVVSTPDILMSAEGQVVRISY